MSHSPQCLMTCSVLVFICVCVDYGNFQMEPTKSNSSEVSRLEIPRNFDKNVESAYNALTINLTTSFQDEQLKNLSSSSNMSFTKHFSDDQVLKTTFTTTNLSEFALEGGGIGVPLQNSSVKSQDDKVLDEEIHNKGSKGRKGVKFPGSSVVPRKGVSVAVDHPENLPINATTEPKETYINSSFANNNTIPATKPTLDSEISFSISDKQSKPAVKTQMQGMPIFIPNSTHSKKPEYVSDAKDVDDFDKYSIIQTSTTGEDYVIIGIVIVIGIWFSVFGALIFYRRAGEYWDRRHYRRMDFLVEGMYND